jgi:hypothetical protein
MPTPFTIYVTSHITYYQILGKPLIMYLGITTFTFLLATATLGYIYHHGNHRIPFKWHMRFAFTTLSLAAIHGTLGILAYF